MVRSAKETPVPQFSSSPSHCSIVCAKLTRVFREKYVTIRDPLVFHKYSKCCEVQCTFLSSLYSTWYRAKMALNFHFKNFVLRHKLPLVTLSLSLSLSRSSKQGSDFHFLCNQGLNIFSSNYYTCWAIPISFEHVISKRGQTKTR